MKLSEVVAIDTHVHLHDAEATAYAQQLGEARLSQQVKYTGKERKVVPAPELAEQYRQRKMMVVLMNSTDFTVTGRTPVPNDHIAKVVADDPDVFIGMGIVDPWLGKPAIDEIKRCALDLGLKGIGEFNPARQHFFTNDQRFYPLWETCQELGLVVLFHSGMAASGAGTPGGSGLKLKYSRPIPHFDDVAADFPELKIIAAHPSWPYDAESLAIARHKANYFMDLSGWAPKYWSDELVKYASSVLSDKMLFGTDGFISVERWMEEFNARDIKPESRQKILLENAVKLYNLS